MELFLQNIVNGLQWGSFYALIALGYSMVYGVLMLFNFAHGDLFMVGSYIGFFVASALLALIAFGILGGLPSGIALALVLLLTLVITMLLNKWELNARIALVCIVSYLGYLTWAIWDSIYYFRE